MLGWRKGDLFNARENYQTALDLRYKIGDSSKIFGTITNLGSEYQQDFQSDSAMVNYLKAISSFGADCLPSGRRASDLN
jgi:hypothetical protein